LWPARIAALAQVAYYRDEVARDHRDYLSGEGEEPGRWLGAGASARRNPGTTVVENS
jgi:hypothetical protein